MLAPLALGAFVVVFFAIVLSAGSGGGGDDEGNGSADGSAKTTSAPKRDRTTTTQGKRRPATYTVKVGDTLGSISETTGVPVQKLLDLNPALDPQALVSGQKIKLRE
jgi:LysM repeat protein